MPHNGSPLQVNFNFIEFIPGSDPFLNRLKNGSRFERLDSIGPLTPTDLDDNGYPINSNGLWKTYFYLPSEEEVPGPWKVRWKGEGTCGMGSLLTGSTSGVDGWFTFTPVPTEAGHHEFNISATNPSNHLRDVEVYPVSQEALIDAGGMFTPKFLERCEPFGVLRFLNWTLSNGSPVSKWAHRRPLTCAIWGGSELRPNIYKGMSTKVSNDYQIDLGDGGTPADRDTWLVRFPSDGDEDSTLNGKPILTPNGEPMDAQEWFVGSWGVKANGQACVIYDAELDGWLKFGGDTTGLYAGLSNGVPIEVALRLCKEVGAHPWLNVPHLSLDTASGLTDYVTSLAQFCKDYAEDENLTWFQPRYEPSNEVWNTGVAFGQTIYGMVKANFRWGITNDDRYHDWYGRVASLMGEAVSDVYGDDRTKYRMIAGCQTFGSLTPTARLNGRHVTVDGGTPAKNWVTSLAVANYFNPALFTPVYALIDPDANPEWPAAEEWQMAQDYDEADTEGKAAIAAEYAAGCLDASGTYSVPSIEVQIIAFKQFADAQGLEEVTYYEGGYSPDAATADYDGVDGSMELINALRFASKNAPLLKDYLEEMYSVCLRIGVYPSVFELSGESVWAVLEPSIYVTPDPPQWLAIENTVTNETPIRFTFTFTG